MPLRDFSNLQDKYKKWSKVINETPNTDSKWLARSEQISKRLDSIKEPDVAEKMKFEVPAFSSFVQTKLPNGRVVFNDTATVTGVAPTQLGRVNRNDFPALTKATSKARQATTTDDLPDIATTDPVEMAKILEQKRKDASAFLRGVKFDMKERDEMLDGLPGPPIPENTCPDPLEDALNILTPEQREVLENSKKHQKVSKNYNPDDLLSEANIDKIINQKTVEVKNFIRESEEKLKAEEAALHKLQLSQISFKANGVKRSATKEFDELLKQQEAKFLLSKRAEDRDAFVKTTLEEAKDANSEDELEKELNDIMASENKPMPDADDIEIGDLENPLESVVTITKATDSEVKAKSFYKRTKASAYFRQKDQERKHKEAEELRDKELNESKIDRSKIIADRHARRQAELDEINARKKKVLEEKYPKLYAPEVNPDDSYDEDLDPNKLFAHERALEEVKLIKEKKPSRNWSKAILERYADNKEKSYDDNDKVFKEPKKKASQRCLEATTDEEMMPGKDDEEDIVISWKRPEKSATKSYDYGDIQGLGGSDPLDNLNIPDTDEDDFSFPKRSAPKMPNYDISDEDQDLDWQPKKADNDISRFAKILAKLSDSDEDETDKYFRKKNERTKLQKRRARREESASPTGSISKDWVASRCGKYEDLTSRAKNSPAFSVRSRRTTTMRTKLPSDDSDNELLKPFKFESTPRKKFTFDDNEKDDNDFEQEFAEKYGKSRASRKFRTEVDDDTKSKKSSRGDIDTFFASKLGKKRQDTSVIDGVDIDAIIASTTGGSKYEYKAPTMTNNEATAKPVKAEDLMSVFNTPPSRRRNRNNSNNPENKDPDLEEKEKQDEINRMMTLKSSEFSRRPKASERFSKMPSSTSFVSSSLKKQADDIENQKLGITTSSKKSAILGGKAPEIELKMKPLSVDKHRNAKFTCSFSGKPEPEMRWVLNDMPIESDADKYIVTCHAGFATLTIQDVSTTDIGTYVCIAKNDCGEAREYAQLEVK